MEIPQFRRLLVPLDGSDLAERGLAYAVRLARPLAVGLTLLRVTASRRQVADARRYLESVAGRARAEGGSVDIVTPVGDPASEVLSAERDGDLVVMTSHGSTGLERFLLGSVADRVVHYGPAPVFLARAFRPVATTLSPVLIPLDGSEFAERILPYARLFARALQADIKLVRVIYTRTFDTVAYPPQITAMTLEWERAEGTRYIQTQIGSLERDGLRVRGSVREAEPFEAICGAAAEEEGGFIAMATHARAGLSRTLFGSLAARVGESAVDPVFLLKA